MKSLIYLTRLDDTLVHEIFAWVLFSRSAPARIYNPRELEWFAQLKVRENKIARFLNSIRANKFVQWKSAFSLAKPNFFLPLRENEKNEGARK